MNPKLEQWGMVSDIDPYTAPENVHYMLTGIVTGHPDHMDGKFIRTSFITGVEGDAVTTKNRVYELGAPHPDYEQQFPNAKQRLLDTIRSRTT